MMRYIFYFLNFMYLCRSFYLSETEPTTESPFLTAVTSEEFYFQNKILQHQFFIPGTNYCGLGNRSTGYEDLGWFKNADTCCRDHDMCPDNIPPGKYKHGLHNNAKFTKSHCNCDETFHHCLKNVGTPPAHLIGALYFTFFHIDCYKKEYPIIDCTKWIHRRCLEYKLNFTASPVYQWFDNPFFRHWIDHFPHEIMNATLTNLFFNTTTAINELNATETTVNFESSTVTSHDSQTTTSVSYFGSYFQSFYETVTNYLYNLSMSFVSGGKEIKDVNDYNNNCSLDQFKNEII